jgi:hypothetical protein
MCNVIRLKHNDHLSISVGLTESLSVLCQLGDKSRISGSGMWVSMRYLRHPSYQDVKMVARLI